MMDTSKVELHKPSLTTSGTNYFEMDSLNISQPNLSGSLTSKAILSVQNTLANQADALHDLMVQYESDIFSQLNLAESLEILYYTSHVKRGKIVVCGIGKSFKIANKLVATLNSLSIYSSALHPSEALHGDLGLIDESKDCLIFLTSSGNTPELLQLLPHLSLELPIILLTSNKESKLAQHPQINSLLYAALSTPLNETSIHGIPAPTVSATLSLVLADATILALSEIIEEDVIKRKRTFSMKHPGGSIGVNLSHLNDNLTKTSPATLSEKKSLSSQVSSASLLSLDQLRREFQSTSMTTGSSRQDEKSFLSSLSCSDDESEMLEVNVNPGPDYAKKNKFNLELSELIKSADPSQVLETSEEEVKSLASPVNELKLLQWTTMYDFIVFRELSSAKRFALSSTDIRRYYKVKLTNHFNSNKVKVWSEFTNMVLQTAVPVRLD